MRSCPSSYLFFCNFATVVYIFTSEKATTIGGGMLILITNNVLPYNRGMRYYQEHVRL